VVRSDSGHATVRVVAGAAAMIAVGGLVSGCVTTQQEAARLRLNSDRIRASQTSTRVTVASRTVAVKRITLVSSGGQTAFAVTVRNSGHDAVSDLPISVGYRVGSRHRVDLNASSDAEYFAAHLPVIGGGQAFTWVYTATRRLPAGARPFAIVGATPSVATKIVKRPPVIALRAHAARGAATLEIFLHNLSGVPQLELPVFAFALRGGRAVAAGEATVTELAGGSKQTLRLRLLGRVGQARVRLEAPPTIMQ
jgi:hypothetical protein